MGSAKHLVLLLLLLLLACCSALPLPHPHGASWYHKYIGKVKHAVYHTSAKGKKLVLAATEQNVIAALNIRNGKIIWRQVLVDTDKVNGLDTASGKYAITLSGGNALRAWNILSGQLVWETRFPTFASPPTLDVTPIELHHLKAKMILVFGGFQLYGVSSADGEVLWETNTANVSQGGMFSLRKVLTGEDENSLYGVGFTGTSGFCVWKVYLFTGRLVMQEAATIKANICTDELVVTKHTIVALDCEGKAIFTGHIGPVKSFSIHRTLIRDIVPDAFGRARLLKSTIEGVFVLRFFDQIVFVRIGSSDHDLKVLEIFERPASISNSLELPGNRTAMMLVQHVGLSEERKMAIRVVTREGEKDETLSEILDLDCERGLVQQVHLSGYIRRDRSCGFRALLVMEDQSVVFVQNSKILWTREDGLAAIVDTIAVELPERRFEVKQPSEVHRHRLKGYIEELMALLKGRFSQYKALQDDRSKLVQDNLGFRKLLVVLTRGGKLLAFHTGTGNIVWSLLVPSFQKALKGNKAVVLKLLPWFHQTEPARSRNPVVLVVGNSGSRANASGILAWVDTYTGTELHSISLSYAIEDALPLAWETSQTKKPYMLIDIKKNMHIFPLSLDTLKALQEQKSGFLLPRIDMDKSVISGYGINWSAQIFASTGIPSSYVFKPKKTWKVDFSKRLEKVLAVSEEREAKVVNVHDKEVPCESGSCGIANGNFWLVATASTWVVKVGKENSSEETGLVFYVMDTGTGEILHEFRHPKTQGPVHMVKVENWFAFSYFDLQDGKYKHSVLQILGTSCVEFQNESVVMNASALNQSKRAIKALRSERTIDIPSIKALGIVKGFDGNAKQYVMATRDGQIILSDMTGANRTKRESKIMEWMKPLVDGTRQLYLTQAGQVEGLRKIVCVSSKDGPGSLVFAYGIDIFSTHTLFFHSTPSHFTKYHFYILLATIGGMLVAGSLLATIFMRHRRLKKVAVRIQ